MLVIFIISTACFLNTVEGACKKCDDCCVPEVEAYGSCFQTCFSNCVQNSTVCEIRSCADIYDSGNTNSGVYTLTLPDGQGNDVNVDAYCDMDTDGGRWTVFQKRQDGSVDFARPWVDYKNGFGQANGEHWLGNEYLHHMTSDGQNYELRVDVEGFDGTIGFATYSIFKVNGESDNYRITVEGHLGPMNDSFAFKANSQMFSTFDRDNDNYSKGNCSSIGGSGGNWYLSCFSANLNGQYKLSAVQDWSGVVWFHFRNNNESLKTSKMMFRPVQPQ